jgi:DNA-binding beta-propeller fold protein YncE
MKIAYQATVFAFSLIGAAGAFADAAGPASVSPAVQASSYSLQQTLPLPGDKGWDYLSIDSENRRLYVTHGDQVLVVDIDANTLVGKVDGLQGIHGVALAPELGRGYISDGKAGAVVCFDLKSLAVIATIPAGKRTDAIIYDPFSQQVFAYNGEDASATVIRAKDNKVMATIALGGGPEFSAADGRGSVFVNLEDKSELLKIDAVKRKVVQRWALAPGEGPSAMAYDADGKNLFVGCHNRLGLVIDPATGRIKTSLPIGDRVDAAVYDAGSQRIFYSCGDGTTAVAQKNVQGVFESLPSLATKKGSRTVALDAKTKRLFFASADFTPAPLSSTAEPHPRPAMVPGSFAVLVYGEAPGIKCSAP